MNESKSEKEGEGYLSERGSRLLQDTLLLPEIVDQILSFGAQRRFGACSPFCFTLQLQGRAISRGLLGR